MIDLTAEKAESEVIRSFKKLSVYEKAEKLQQVKKSFMYNKKPSSQIIFNTSNTMVGSAILVMPIYFLQTGILASILSCAFVAAISLVTVNLIVDNYKHGESDLPEQIERIMGLKWKTFFAASSTLLLGFATIAYFLLMANLFYTALESVFEGLPAKDAGIIFGQFSYQWAGIILAIISFIMFNIKAMSVILKINAYGIYAIGIYIIFMIYIGIEAMATGNLKFGSGDGGIVMFSGSISDLITLLGIFALAFISHNILIPIIKYNVNFKNNKRDVGIAYVVTAMIYVMIGVFGSFGIGWRTACFDGKTPATVMDCLRDAEGFTFYFLMIAQALVLIQLTGVLPVLNFITRSQLFGIFYSELDEIPQWKSRVWNTIIILLCVLFEVFNVKPGLLISLCGAVCGFLLVYVIPIAMHFKAVGQPRSNSQQNLLIEEVEENSESATSVVNKGLNGKQETVVTGDTNFSKPEITLKQKVFYGVLLVYGFGIMISELVNIALG